MPAASATAPSRSSCEHTNAHHKGSSTRYRKTTCKDCGVSWQEERDSPTEDPESCPHRRTDHRGSNKFVRKTFCTDCGTYIDSGEQGLAKTLQKGNPWISKEEQVLLDSVSSHEHISKEQAIAAAKLLVAECERLEAGDYTLLSIATMFVDCGDQAIAATDVRVSTGKRVNFSPAERTACMFTN